MKEKAIKIKPIKNERDYEEALENISKLMNAKKNTPRGELLELLSIIVEDYEERRFPIQKLSAREAIELKMEELDLTKNDLAQYFGGKARVSEFFNGKRNLSINTIKQLNTRFKIPLEFLVYG